MKLHQSDLASVFAVAVSGAGAGGASAALAANAQAVQTRRMLVSVFKTSVSEHVSVL